MAITQYSGAMREKYNVVAQLGKEIKALDDVKKRVAGEIEGLQGRYNTLSKPSAAESYSLEELQYRIQQKEHYLTTSDINKREEARLYNEINELKRALQKARPSIEIESEVGKLKDQIDILYKELKAIKSELHVKITESQAIRAELEALERQRKNEQGTVAEQRSVEEIKKEYDDRIKALEARRDALEDAIDDYLDKHSREVDNWEDQQDLLNYIDWVKDQVVRVKGRKEEEERRKKEKEDYEKRKLKEKEEYEKRK
jgi:regulator of replication initiation timing